MIYLCIVLHHNGLMQLCSALGIELCMMRLHAVCLSYATMKIWCYIPLINLILSDTCLLLTCAVIPSPFETNPTAASWDLICFWSWAHFNWIHIDTQTRDNLTAVSHWIYLISCMILCQLEREWLTYFEWGSTECGMIHEMEPHGPNLIIANAFRVVVLTNGTSNLKYHPCPSILEN